MSVQDLAGRLRRETRAAHTALENALPISHGEIVPADYRDHLRFLLSVYEPLETRLKRVPTVATAVPDLDDRWKSHLLRDDLAGDTAGPRPSPRSLPDPQVLVQALGILYVLEGATLGARVLLPVLKANRVLPGTIGAGYLTCYGPRTSLMWKKFCDALNRVPADDAGEVVSWANATFEDLLAWRREWESRS